jgi:ABC-type proline/glycine betaine transport system ATPase subunit
MQADKLAVLRDGRLVQTGTHSELMAQEGYYKELMAAQERRAVKLANIPRDPHLDKILRTVLQHFPRDAFDANAHPQRIFPASLFCQVIFRIIFIQYSQPI